MRILHIASEVVPWSQTGGLAQVLGALPRALATKTTDEIAWMAPLYQQTRAAIERAGKQLQLLGELTVSRGEFTQTMRIHRLANHTAPQCLFVECNALFDRPGLYGDGSRDYDDNAQRFALFCQAVLDASAALLPHPPDVIHCHDWQTGLLPLLAQTSEQPWCRNSAFVFTIHNLAFQGLFHKSYLPRLGLDWDLFKLSKLESNDQLSFLKAGVAFADAVTTVSPTYAREILTPRFGCGLHEFLIYSAHRLVGIRNGIDTDQWNPAADPHIAGQFSADNMAGKQHCRNALLSEFGLAAGNNELVIGVVSRFDYQKGLDLVAELAGRLAALNAKLIVLGSGDPQLERRFQALSRAHATRLAVHVGFDVAMAHRIFAGCDALCMPSRFEPCGLAQMSAMRYGTLPIVRPVGGLRDTVSDPTYDSTNSPRTGFCFGPITGEALASTVRRASDMFRDDPAAWRAAMHTAMTTDWSWFQAASQYRDLYSQVLTQCRRRHEPHFQLE